jgi:hypothetical protein
MLVCELIFKLSDFTGSKQKKSTKNKEFYLLFIPIIFKDFMKISIDVIKHLLLSAFYTIYTIKIRLKGDFKQVSSFGPFNCIYGVES